MEEKTVADKSLNEVSSGEEINLVDLTREIWKGRKLILQVTVIFLLVGVILAFGTKVEYEASSKLMPESQDGIKPNLGGLGSLAGLAGINLDMSNSGTITPELYPQISQSVPFMTRIWNHPIEFEKQDTVATAYLFLKEINKPSLLGLLFKYTIGLPFQVKDWVSVSDKLDEESVRSSSSEIIRLNKEDTEILKQLRERISVEVDAKSGILTLRAQMPDALASAQMAQISTDLLTTYLTEYKIKKAKQNLDFIQARHDESKKEFEQVQERLALFNDQNKNVVTSLAQAEAQQIQNEYDLAFEIYKSLASQLEQSKIKVKEETPVFTVLEPVKVPVEKKKPKRLLMMLIATFLGFFFGLFTLYTRHLYFKYKNLF